MSAELDRIANILRETIKSRQVLAIGEAQFSAVQGKSALFTTASGTIGAIATNFCYGRCLLHKVEGVWYALNPNEGGVEIRSSVDRQIWRRPKGAPKDTYPDRFIGINDFVSPRKLIYDFDVNLTQLFAGLFAPPINPSIEGIFIDNIVDGDESDLKDGYWRVACANTYRFPYFFFWVDSNGQSGRYDIPQSQTPNNSSPVYVGRSKFFSLFGTLIGGNGLPSPFSQILPMRFYSPSGIETGQTVLTSYTLQAPDLTGLAGAVNPAPASVSLPRAILGSYYQDRDRRQVVFDNRPPGQSIDPLIDVTITTVSYEYTGINVNQNGFALNVEANSKLPLLIGQKTLARIISTPILEPTGIEVADYINYDRGLGRGTKVGSRSRIKRRSNTVVSYDLDGLTIDLNQYTGISQGTGIFTQSSFFSLVGTDTIAFSNPFDRFTLQIISAQTLENDIVTGTTYIPNPDYTNFKNAKVAIVTDRIKNCRITDLQVQPIPNTTNEYGATSATYTVLNDYENTTDFRALIFIQADIFEPRSTIIVNSEDCYAKFYHVIDPNYSGKLYALEFWVDNNGAVDLVKIHDRETLPGETIEHFRSERIYYPGGEE